MSWPFTLRSLLEPGERYIWVPIRILRETDKTILVDTGIKIWIPKSRIYGIRLRTNVFEVYIKENIIP